MSSQQAPVRAPSKPKRMTLGAIRTTLDRGPFKVLLYGVEGCGKTSWAAAAPMPVFIAAEDGIRNLNPQPASFPDPESFQDVLDAVEELTRSEHDFQTLVIDTIDAVDGLIKDHVIRRNGWAPEEFDAYGRGLKITPDEHRKLILAIDRLVTAKKMNVIVIAHSRTKSFKNPAGADYLRFEPNLAGDAPPALWKYWAEAVLFATYETFVHVQKGGSDDASLKRGKATSAGRRIVHTEWSAAFDAKNRYGLPAELSLEFSEFEAARLSGRPASPEKLEAEARTLLDSLAPAEATKTAIETKLRTAAGDAAALAKIVDFLKTKVAEKESQ